jgi:hypothetical protein
MRIRDTDSVDLTLKNLIGIIAAIGVALWFAFGVLERLNAIETSLLLKNSDIEKNTHFRIKWPLGELGALPDDSEQFMLIEHLGKTVDKIESKMDDMTHNEVNINVLKDDVEDLKDDVERLKDKQREFTNGNK